MDNLILIEHDGQKVKPSSLGALGLAKQLGGTASFCLLGQGLDAMAESLREWGADLVIAADDESLSEPLADRYAEVLAQAVRHWKCTRVLGVASTFSKDVLPRVAALLDAPMVSEIVHAEQIDGEWRFQRPVSAGSLLATVVVDGDLQVLTVRGTAYPVPPRGSSACPVERFAFDKAAVPSSMQFVSRDAPVSDRPDLSEARVVVCGGRPLQSKETFEHLIGGLADVLDAAVGATRAAVDSGMAPNDWQVGQTGKTIAPELYISVGVSGAIQHLAGIQDSRVIVAINRDPEAPIFQVANYGLVGDLHEVVPEMIERLTEQKG